MAFPLCKAGAVKKLNSEFLTAFCYIQMGVPFKYNTSPFLIDKELEIGVD